MAARLNLEVLFGMSSSLRFRDNYRFTDYKGVGIDLELPHLMDVQYRI